MRQRGEKGGLLAADGTVTYRRLALKTHPLHMACSVLSCETVPEREIGGTEDGLNAENSSVWLTELFLFSYGSRGTSCPCFSRCGLSILGKTVQLCVPNRPESQEIIYEARKRKTTVPAGDNSIVLVLADRGSCFMLCYSSSSLTNHLFIRTFR